MTDDLALPKWAQQPAQAGQPPLPKWASAPAPVAAPKGALRQGVEQQWEMTKNIGKGMLSDMGDEAQLGRDIMTQGKQEMAQPGVMAKVGGAAGVARGAINYAAAPLTAVWNALGMADPMMTGGEGLHVAGEALKAPEKPVAAPAIKSGEKVITGPNHAAIEAQAGLKAPQEGFVKPDGAFVPRKEAAALAEAAGEAKPETTGKGLHSEDLPPQNKPPVVQDQALPKWASLEVQEGEPTKPYAPPTDDAFDMAVKGELTSKTARERADAAKAGNRANEDAVLGADADRWRKAHRGMDSAANMADDARMDRHQAIIDEIEGKLSTKQIDALYQEGEDHQPWVDLGNRLSEVEYSRDDAIGQLAYELRKVPDKGLEELPKSSTAREALAVIQHALAKEQERGGDPMKMLKEAVDAHFAAYKRGGASDGDAAELTVSAMERLSALMPKQAARSPELPKIEAPKPAAPKATNYTGATVMGQPAPVEAPGKPVEPKPQAVGAGAASIGDILRDNIAQKEKAAAKTPGWKEGLKAAWQTVKSILHPQALDASGRRAEGSFRLNMGRNNQIAERAKAGMEQFRKLVNSFDLNERLAVLDWIQNPGAKTAHGWEPSEELAPLLNHFKALMQDYRRQLEALPATEQLKFEEDFASQMWEEPAKASGFYGTKEGSKGFTKAKKYPSYAEGIRAGLIPKTTDPIAIATLYADNVSRFIAREQLVADGIDAGDVVWRSPSSAPEGWVELNGRVSHNRPGEKAYAPPGFAAIYNNSISRIPSNVYGDVLKAVQRVTNYSTALQLGLSGYHAINTVKESVVSAVASALFQASHGAVVQGLTNIAKAPFKPITGYLQGKKMAKAFLDGVGDTELRRIMELAVDANFRIVGKGRAADDYRYAASNYWDAWKRGSLKADFAASAKNIMGAPITGTAKELFKGIGKTLETLTKPLFESYIPMVKSGAYFDGMKAWLDLHPTASIEEQRAYAKTLADIIDDRFGEMNTDNTFWHAMQKAIAQSMVVSYSYEMGTLRSFGGAAVDAASALKGKDPRTEKVAYIAALAIVTGTISAIEQYIRTGKPPSSFNDLRAPQAGGTDAGTGQRERAINPGYESQLNTFVTDPKMWLSNKKNHVWELVGDLWTGKDWSSTEIGRHKDDMETLLMKFAEHVFKSSLPIPAQVEYKKGSKIGGFERFLGVRPAPMQITAPEQFKRMMDRKNRAEDKAADRRDKKHKALLDTPDYGGTQ